jgi:nucleoside-diphosphate-sugar epimerase
MSGKELKTLLVIGASGVVGAGAIEHFAGLANWTVIGASRRRPALPKKLAFEHLALDLTDSGACGAAASRLAGVTHVIYAALLEKPGLIAGWYERDLMQANLAMMRNLMEPLLKAASHLRHISIMQGTKAYGVHVHPVKIPLRESAPRDQHENFYWLQEDYIRDMQKSAGFRLTIWRPQIICGGATGVAMNLIPVLGAYAAVCRELNLPFRCPSVHGNILELVDTNLIARALEWAAEAPAADGEIFNITNGDVVVWPNVWAAIAEAVGLAHADGEPLSLAKFLVEHAGVWERVVEKFGLEPNSMHQLLGESHHYADLMLGSAARETPPSILVSTVKLRQAGFNECVDSEVMLRTWLQRLAERKILPPAASPAPNESLN